MNLHTSNENYFACTESKWLKHSLITILYCISKDGTVASKELREDVTGLVLDGDRLLCLAEHRGKKYSKSIILHTFDMNLQEITSEVLAKAEYGIWSTMDSSFVTAAGSVLIGQTFLKQPSFYLRNDPPYISTVSSSCVLTAVVLCFFLLINFLHLGLDFLFADFYIFFCCYKIRFPA